MPKGGHLNPEAQKIQARILDLLRANPNGLTTREIGDLIGKSTAYVFQAINYMSLNKPIYDDAGLYFLLDWRRL